LAPATGLPTPDPTAACLLRRSVPSGHQSLTLLIEALNAKAVRAAEVSEQIDFADFLFRRCAELREAVR
jgi:hypothetical protein